METQGIIRPSISPWASPIVLVRKKSGKVRPCVDYRRLNAITTKDAFPLPRVSDCLDSVAGATLFSCFDVTSGYHQIPVKESDIPKTAFCTKYGLYEYVSMPMGLTNSPATFQRLMELALSGLQWHTCLIYLDDIVVFGSNFDEHLQRVQEVLERIRTAGLKLKPEKCQLVQKEVDFLGHLVSAEGLRPNPHNIAKVEQWPVPTNVTDVRRILGLGNYYRRFVKNYSQLVRPLTDLTRKGASFVWTADCQSSFDALKRALIGSDVMAYPKDTGQYILDTDASDGQIAGILSQIQDGHERVISYGSRTLGKAEKNYCITDKELLAIRHFVEHYRQYLLGRTFLVRSDHQALVWLFKLKEPKGRIARWIELLSEYDFSIEYRPGAKHANADALSRCPNPWECRCSELDNLEQLRCGPCPKCRKRTVDMQYEHVAGESTEQVQNQKELKEIIRMATSRSGLSDACDDSGEASVETQLSEHNDLASCSVAEKQQSDDNLKLIIEAMKKGSRPCHSEVVSMNPAIRHYWSIWDSLEIHDGCLYKRFYQQNDMGSFLQLIVPKVLKGQILHQMHNNLLSGHFGERKTYTKMQQRFYWYKMREDVQQWVKTCLECQVNKKPHKLPRAPLGGMLVGSPLDRLSTDFLGPFPVTPRGNKYIMVVTDTFTKWVDIFALPDQSAKRCANVLLNEVISRFGTPLSIHSDQGRNYESTIFRELCRLFEIKKTRTSIRNPRGNGQTERFNRTLLNMIKKYLEGEQDAWDLNLGCLAGAYRATPHAATGLTPNLLILGREVRLPIEVMYETSTSSGEPVSTYCQYVASLQSKMQKAHNLARTHLNKNVSRQKDIYDSKLVFHPYAKGDVVWYLNEARIEGLSPKLQPTYLGPYLIIEKLNDLVFKIQVAKSGRSRIVHHNKLKRFEGHTYPKWIGACKVSLMPV